MGMSASQARFLSLTARKNNVEFEGQQINQQRTTLSNQSASYYSELCNMVVPTPPSIDDYTKVSYTFNDGALNNTISTMMVNPSKPGFYSIGYIQQWQDDYSIVSAASSLISNADGTYKIGSTELRKLGQPEGLEVDSNITLDGIDYNVEKDENGYYINKSVAVAGVQECTEQEIANLEYYIIDNDTNITQVYKDNDGSFYSEDENGNKTTRTGITESSNNLIMCLYDSTKTNPDEAVLLVVKDEDGKYYKEATTKEVEKHYLTTKELASISTYEDKESSEILAMLEEEELYRKLLNEQYNAGKDGDWYVRYIKNSSTGINVPYFYNADQVRNDNLYADNYASISCYTIGSSTKTQEVLNQPGKVEKDSSGRYISIVLYQTDDEGNILEDQYTTYSLTTNTSTDEEAYNDAMNKYNYEQHQYDQKIQEINSKLEIVQQQDKSLELNLKQLDTEENAISTELDSVKKIISKNIESSFKTFNA